MIPSIITGGIFISCQKETSCEECRENNKTPIAIAGPDQVNTLPTDSVLLDGSASNDPDGMIISYLWKKISGLAFFNMPLVLHHPDSYRVGSPAVVGIKSGSCPALWVGQAYLLKKPFSFTERLFALCT